MVWRHTVRGEPGRAWRTARAADLIHKIVRGPALAAPRVWIPHPIHFATVHPIGKPCDVRTTVIVIKPRLLKAKLDLFEEMRQNLWRDIESARLAHKDGLDAHAGLCGRLKSEKPLLR